MNMMKKYILILTTTSYINNLNKTFDYSLSIIGSDTISDFVVLIFDWSLILILVLLICLQLLMIIALIHRHAQTKIINKNNTKIQINTHPTVAYNLIVI